MVCAGYSEQFFVNTFEEHGFDQEPAFVHLPQNEEFFCGKQVHHSDCRQCLQHMVTIRHLQALLVNEREWRDRWIRTLQDQLTKALQGTSTDETPSAVHLKSLLEQGATTLPKSTAGRGNGDPNLSSAEVLRSSLSNPDDTEVSSLPEVSGQSNSKPDLDACASGVKAPTLPEVIRKPNRRPEAFRLNCAVPALVRAAEKGDSNTLVALLDSGEDPNSSDSFGLTSLHAAAKKGRLDVVAELLHRNANANAQATSLHRETPLHYASKYGHLKVVHMLLASGACATVKTTDGKTPLDHSRSRGHSEVEALLLRAETAD